MYRAAVAVLLFAFVATAKAAIIQVASPTAWSAGTGTGGFEVFPADLEPGSLVITYNTNVADTNPTAGVGEYANAIIGFTMSVEQQTRPDLMFILSGPSKITTDSSTPWDFWITFEAQTTELNGNFQDMWFRVALAFSVPLDYPETLPGPELFSRILYWKLGMGTGADGFSVSETDYFYAPQATYIEVPEPASSALMFAALLSLALAYSSAVRAPSTRHLA